MSPTLVVAACVIVSAGCQSAKVNEGDRAAALKAATDTAAATWKHSVGADSVRTRGDTVVVYVSPTQWMATDAPQAVVHVLPRGRIVKVQWILGG